MGFLSNLFSGGAGDLVKSVGGVLDNVITTKEEKLQLENEMKKAENEYKIEMRKLDVSEKQMVFDDINSARTRETAVQTSSNATWLSKNVSPLLAMFTSIITFTLFFFLIFNPQVFDPTMKDVVIYILGVLSAILTQIYSYYFGSSHGSSEKNQHIKELTNRINNN